jgi:hypothetical protein
MLNEIQFVLFNSDEHTCEEQEHLRICNKCKKPLTLNNFSKHSGSNYFRPECKKCNNELGKIRKNLKTRYGDPPDGYKCPICNRSEEECSGEGGLRNGGWVIDHCHAENVFRGWLCHKCNRAIGCFDDNIERLEKAIEYLNNEPIQ